LGLAALAALLTFAGAYFFQALAVLVLLFLNGDKHDKSKLFYG
jgi:hypothetical protein